MTYVPKHELYGAQPFDLVPPNNSVYLAVGGDDSGSGHLDQPLGSLSEAIKRVPNLGHVVVREGGLFLEGDLWGPWEKSFTIQAAPGELPIFSGSAMVSPLLWQPHASGIWKHDAVFWDFDHTPADPQMVDPNFPLSQHPENVWDDQGPLTQVGGLLGLDNQRKFYYDQPNHTLYIGVNPHEHLINISRFQTFFTGTWNNQTQRHPRVDVHGLWIEQFSPTSKQLAPLRLHAHRTQVTHCTLAFNGMAPLFVQSCDEAFVHKNTLHKNGQLGFHGFKTTKLDFGYNIVTDNNFDRTATYSAAGGLKADTKADETSIHHNYFARNIGHGAWLDLASYGITMARNIVKDHRHGAGLYYELGQEGVLVGNYLENNLIGTLASGSGMVEMAYNTYVNCDTDDRVQRENRPDEPGKIYTHPQDEFSIHSNLYVKTRTTPSIIHSYEDYSTIKRDSFDAGWAADHNIVRKVSADGVHAVMTTVEGGTTNQRAIFVDAALFRAVFAMDMNTEVFIGTLPDDARESVVGEGLEVRPELRPILELPATGSFSQAGWFGPEYIAQEPPEEPPVSDPTEPTVIEKLQAHCKPIDDAIDYILELEGENEALEATIEGQDAAIVERNQTIAARDQTIQEMTVVAEQRDAIIVCLDGKVNELTQRLEDCDCPEALPTLAERLAPFEGKHLLGWSAKPGTIVAYEGYIPIIGQDGNARRVFPSGDNNWEDDYADGRGAFIEIPLSATNADAEALRDRIIALNKPIFVCIGHEEERSEKGNTPAGYQADYNRLFPILNQAPKALIGGVVMLATIRGINGYVGTTDEEIRAWLPEPGKCHFLGIDMYVQNTTNLPFASITNQLAKARQFGAELGVPLIHAEFGVAGTEAQRSAFLNDWLNTMASQAASNDPQRSLGTFWFNSDIGGNPPTIYPPTTPPTKGWMIDRCADKNPDVLTPQRFNQSITLFNWNV